MNTTNKITATLARAAYPLSIFSWRNFALVWSSMTLVGVGLLLLSFFIQEGQFSNYKKRYERHKEKGV